MYKILGIRQEKQQNKIFFLCDMKEMLSSICLSYFYLRSWEYRIAEEKKERIQWGMEQFTFLIALTWTPATIQSTKITILL